MVLELGAEFNQGRYIGPDHLAQDENIRNGYMLGAIVFQYYSPLHQRPAANEDGAVRPYDQSSRDANGRPGQYGHSSNWQQSPSSVRRRTHRSEEHVRRLRQRIFTASQAGDLKRVRNLQKLMLRSRSNALVSVRQVTELNAGRSTAGVDGEVVLTPEAKAELADWVQRRAEPWTARPVRRVYIPKRAPQGNGARSASRRRRHSATPSSDLSGSVVVTHPFHPLRGQRLEVLFVKRRGPAVVFVCSGGVSGQITLPESWTDRGQLPLAGRLSAEGLAALDTLARAIRVVDCDG